MNRDDIIRMARGAAVINCDCCLPFWPEEDQVNWEIFFERFATLVAAAERERIKWDTIHSCHPECDKPVCVAIRKAVAEEREACAKVCEEIVIEGWRDAGWDMGTIDCAAAIRARGDALAKLNQAAEDNGEPL